MLFIFSEWSKAKTTIINDFCECEREENVQKKLNWFEALFPTHGKLSNPLRAT